MRCCKRWRVSQEGGSLPQPPSASFPTRKPACRASAGSSTCAIRGWCCWRWRRDLLLRGFFDGPLDERRKQVDGHGKKRRRVVFAGDFPHRLQKAQLQGDGLLGDQGGGLHHFLGGLKLAFGVDDLG